MTTDLNEHVVRRFKPYPEYKDSGIEWLGKYPKPWKLKPLKYVASYNDEALPESTAPDFVMQYVDISGVDRTKGIQKTEEYQFEKAPSRARRKVRAGDTIISTVRTYLKAIAPIKAPPENLIVSTGFAVIRPGLGILKSYLSYQLQSEGFVQAVVANSVGVSYPAINASILVTLSALMPSMEEQQAIANFLDQETARIDELIAKKQRLIELLQEKRTALISQAVTKGLNPNAPMNDSGIDWLLEIPKHWDVVRVKWVSKLESGHTPSKQVPEYWEDCDIPWVSLNDSKQLAVCDYIAETKYKINSLGLENSSARLLPPGAVVFTRDATIGLAAITSQPMAVSQHLIAWIPGTKIRTEFLLRVFNVMKGYLDSFTFGATIKTIGMPDVKKLVTPLPPLKEQEEIENHIRMELEKHDDLLKLVKNAIESLQEYRTALISAAVTGKIDVRHLATESVNA